MFFCYVDESGDCGPFDPKNPDKSGSPYFIFSGLIISSDKWKQSLDCLKKFRKKIAKEAILPYSVEFHCAEMIDPHKIKEFTSISVPDRWKMIEEYSEVIGSFKDFYIISVVIDKKLTFLQPSEYLTACITKLYLAFDEFLKPFKQYGLVFFDRANEKMVTSHARKLLGTGASHETIPGIRVERIIEDPIFRISSDSMFIQSADVITYTLKEKEFPKTSRKKLQAHKIFERKLKQICFKSSFADEEGIIRQ